MTTRRLIIMFVLEAIAFAWLAFALLDRRIHQQVQTEYRLQPMGLP